MEGYRIVEHTADAQIEVYGRHLTGLFEQGLKGMNAILYPYFCQNENEFPCQQLLHCSSIDNTALLIDFLSEVLWLTHTKHILFCEIDIQYLRDQQLKAVLYGKRVDKLQEDIKAVTYHNAEIQKGDDEYWRTDIVFDI